MHSVKFSSGYGFNFAWLVSMKELKLNFAMMMSRDCHVLMTSLLPVVIKNVLPLKVRETVMSLCFFFNAIEQKVIDDDSLPALERWLQETLCLKEAFFPPTFFDIMVHLVQEIHYLGPSYLHQMFPYERYMGIMKSFVNNRKYSEGNIISRYGTEEAVEWSMTYLIQITQLECLTQDMKGGWMGLGLWARSL